MGATVPRHALIFRVHRLALAGTTGAWLMAGMLGTGSARAGEPVGARPKRTEANASAPVPTARGAHQAYRFFPGDRRATPLPEATGARANATPTSSRPAVQPGRSYLFFSPQKTSGPKTSAPAARPAPSVPKSPIVSAKVADEEGLSLAPSRPSLIFFSPKRVEANSGPSPVLVTNLKTRTEGRNLTALASMERVPVRLPGPPTRRPPPYLIFQPKQVRDRLSPAPSAAPRARGTPPSVTTPPIRDVTTMVPKPGSRWFADLSPLPASAGKLAPTIMVWPPSQLSGTPGTIFQDASGGGGSRQPLRRRATPGTTGIAMDLSP
ncbi:hypothetical protein SAMN05444166_0027 [Singulisphaera sp. GP187]|uniref:hypothetical protein n=1 Tax=Singulisphaera sp. GP187 TaxID=1882752 RepID=UPI0009289CDB|nr:hypothetical protein [Singulisphaera sp. GP187]SIN67840.1 hypothetical protein SAMN05444166_0027 [Singulisphaera sp. GP187]